MELEIPLGEFFSYGDEKRFFQGLSDIPAIKAVNGVGLGLVVSISSRSLNNGNMRELLALFRRYGIPLSTLRVFAEKYKKFSWLKDEDSYWYEDMFQK